MTAVLRDLALDADGDLALVNGDLVFVDGIDAVRQDAESALQLWLGEWFLAPAEGLPYLTEILVKAPNLARIRAIFDTALRARPGVKDVLEIKLVLDRATRRLTGTFRLLSEVGVITGAIGRVARAVGVLLDGDDGALLLEGGSQLLLE